MFNGKACHDENNLFGYGLISVIFLMVSLFLMNTHKKSRGLARPLVASEAVSQCYHLHLSHRGNPDNTFIYYSLSISSVVRPVASAICAEVITFMAFRF